MSKPVSKAHTLTHRHFMDLNLLLDAAALDAMRTGDAGGRGGAGGAGGAAGAAPGAAEAVFLRRFAVQFMGGRQVQSPRDRAALESFTAKVSVCGVVMIVSRCCETDFMAVFVAHTAKAAARWSDGHDRRLQQRHQAQPGWTGV